MNRINIIIWLSAGIMIGWFVSWIATVEHNQALRLEMIEEKSSDNS
jgi:hypothetical protein